jgi:hypothetical protein
MTKGHNPFNVQELHRKMPPKDPPRISDSTFELACKDLDFTVGKEFFYERDSRRYLCVVCEETIGEGLETRRRLFAKVLHEI